MRTLEEKFALQSAEIGHLHEVHPGRISESAVPVLATPALAGAFVTGAAVVTGAYAAGKAVG
jgi:hypothetical protein